MKEESEKTGLLAQAAYSVLTPLAVLLIRHGYAYRDLCNVLKWVYFRTGIRLLKTDGKRITESQLSVLTGLNRKEISALMEAHEDDALFAKQSRSVCSAIVAEWISNPLFINSDGSPKDLAYTSDDAAVASFSKLTEMTSKDIRPKAVLEEMLRLDVISVSAAPERIVSLKKEAFIPSSDFKEKMLFMSSNIRDHLQASTDNILSSQAVHFDRGAYHDELTLEDVKELQALVNKEGMALLKRVYREAEAKAAKNIDNSQTHRMNVGIFFYSQSHSDDASEKREADEEK